jgi:hypothetical protein
MEKHTIHDHHKQAAKHHEQAARHHREAAEHAEMGEHEKAAHHSKIAHGHSLYAAEHHQHASKKHADQHSESGEPDMAKSPAKKGGKSVAASTKAAMKTATLKRAVKAK